MVVVTKTVYKQYLKVLEAQQNVCSADIFVPDKWEDFCSSIQIASGGKICNFNPYKYQILLNKLIEIFGNVTVVKTRQLGTTQMIISKFVHKGAKNSAYSAMAFMRKDDDAKALGRRVIELVEAANLSFMEKSDVFFRLSNKAQLMIGNSSKQGSRSLASISDLLFDEAAFLDNFKSIFESSVPSTALVENPKIIVVSTPSGRNGPYWDRLTSNNGDKDIEAICEAVGKREIWSDDLPGFYWFEDELGGCKAFIHWRCHPVYRLDDNFVEKKRIQYNLSYEAAEREFNLVFLDPAIEVFSAESIIDAEDDIPPFKGKGCSVGLYTSEKSDGYTSVVATKSNQVIKCLSEKNPSANTAIALFSRINEEFSVTSLVLKKANGGEEIAKRIKDKFRNVTVVDIQKSKYPNTIASLNLLLEARKIQIPQYKNHFKDPPIAKHLRDFRRQGTNLGSLEDGKRDDCAWALAFAVMASEYSPKRLPFASS